MLRCAVLVTTMAGLLITLPACNKMKNGAPDKTHDSPHVVFDAAVAAEEREDWPAFIACLTEDSRDSYAFSMVRSAVYAKEDAEFEREKGKEFSKVIDDVMKKHGLSVEMVKKGPHGLDAGGDERGAIKEFVAPIKDKPAFVAEMAAVMKKMGETNAFIGGELTDVRVEGDRATAKMKRSLGGRDYEQAIEFRKVQGGWKIELPEDNDLNEVPRYEDLSIMRTTAACCRP